jgi:hypothetical protein
MSPMEGSYKFLIIHVCCCFLRFRRFVIVFVLSQCFLKWFQPVLEIKSLYCLQHMVRCDRVLSINGADFIGFSVQHLHKLCTAHKLEFPETENPLSSSGAPFSCAFARCGEDVSYLPLQQSTTMSIASLDILRSWPAMLSLIIFRRVAEHHDDELKPGFTLQ